MSRTDEQLNFSAIGTPLGAYLLTLVNIIVDQLKKSYKNIQSVAFIHVLMFVIQTALVEITRMSEGHRVVAAVRVRGADD